MKCTLFTIKKTNLDKVLLDNQPINDYLMSKWKMRHEYLQNRIEKYVDLRFKNQLKASEMY